MLKKAGHMVLVLLLSVSTTGMTIDLHYCNHILYDIGVFSEAENCCMPHEKEHKNNHHHTCDIDNQQKGDCEDESINVEHIDDFLTSTSNFGFNDYSSFVNAFFMAQILKNSLNPPALAVKEIPARDNAPPGLAEQLSLRQSYLL